MAYIFGEITDQTAEEVIRAVNAGNLHTIWLCSHGGDLLAALAIYDAIVGKGVTVIGTGFVASAAVNILLAGDQRYATENTRFMTHPVSLDGEEDSSPEDEEELNFLQGIIASQLNHRAGIPMRKAKSMIASVNNFGVTEAIELGIIHSVKGAE